MRKDVTPKKDKPLEGLTAAEYRTLFFDESDSFDETTWEYPVSHTSEEEAEDEEAYEAILESVRPKPKPTTSE